MKVKLHDSYYTLVEAKTAMQPNGAGLLSLKVEVDNLEKLMEDARGLDEIDVYNGSTVMESYDGYVNLKSGSLEDGVATVVLKQESVTEQMNALYERVRKQDKLIDKQNKTIAAQQGVIAEQAERIAGLEGTQAEQDDAINYLLMADEEEE